MFNSFVGTQTPNVQYWDFSKARAGSSNAFISLEDDCAPLQYFSTGGTTTAIKLYLPINPPNGKQITIVNNQIGTSTQQVTVYDSVNNNSQIIFNIGAPQTITLIYIAQNVGINSGTTTTFPTGWVSLNNSTLTSGPASGSIMHGSSNTMNNSLSSVIGGGNRNTLGSAATCVIAGGALNSNAGYGSGVIGGGTSNSVTGNLCTVGGGQSNTAGTAYSVIAGGFSNSTQGQYGTVAGGNSNTTGSGFFSTIAGGSTNVTANNGTFIGGGANNNCTGNYASILGGNNATTRVIDGMSSINASNIVLARVGGMQSSLLNLYCQTTTATASTLSSNNGAISTANQIILPDNAVYYYKGSVVANGQFNATTPITTTATTGVAGTATITFAAQTSAPFTVGQTITVAGVTPTGYNATAIVTACTSTTVSYTNATTGAQTVAGTIIGQGSTSAWTIEGLIKRVVGASQTFLVGTPTVTLIARDANAATWAIAVTADTVNGGLTLTATGVAGQTISWVARINTTESTY